MPEHTPLPADWQSWPVAYKVLTTRENGDMTSLNINNEYTVTYREGELVVPVLKDSPLWVYLSLVEAEAEFRAEKRFIVAWHGYDNDPISYGTDLYQVRIHPSYRTDYTCQLPTGNLPKRFVEFWQSEKQYPLNMDLALKEFGFVYETSRDESIAFTPSLVLEKRIDVFLIDEINDGK